MRKMGPLSISQSKRKQYKWKHSTSSGIVIPSERHLISPVEYRSERCGCQDTATKKREFLFCLTLKSTCWVRERERKREKFLPFCLCSSLSNRSQSLSFTTTTMILSFYVYICAEEWNFAFFSSSSSFSSSPFLDGVSQRKKIKIN